MGFVNDKNETINSVALFEVLNSLPNTKSTSSLNSVTSKSKNLLPFLTDLLSVTCKDKLKDIPIQPNKRDKVLFLSACESERILIEILVKFFPTLIKILKVAFIKAIKAGLMCSTNFTLPNVTGQSTRVKVNIKDLDRNGLLKINPTSSVGSTFYGKNATKDLNWYLNDLVQNGGSGNWAGVMKLNYNKPTQEIEFGIDPSYNVNGDKTFDGFLVDYTNSIELMTLEGFMSKLTNKLTGTMTAALQNPPSLDSLVSLEMVDSLIDKILDSDPCKEDYQFDDGYFKFNNDEINKMEEVARQKLVGITNLDLGCGVVPSTINPDIVKNLFDDVRNAEPSKINSVVENSINTINDSLTSNVSEKDKSVAKASLNKKMLEEIPKILTSIVFEPKMIMLYEMSSALVNGTTPTSSNTSGGVNVDDKKTSFDFAKANSVFFEFVARESLAALLEIIFEQVKREIIRLVSQTIKKQIKEISNKKLKQLAFLTNGVVGGILQASIPTPDKSKYV